MKKLRQMTFRDSREDMPSSKVYLHPSGTESFNFTGVEFSEILRATPHMYRANHSYIIAILWGNEGVQMADFFGYSGIEQWPGNPEVSCWVMKGIKNNSAYTLNRGIDITCGDGTIILGYEEEYRRQTNSLTDFLKEMPDLKELHKRLGPSYNQSP